MWLLEIEPGSFAGAVVLLATEVPIQTPKLSEVNCIYSCTTHSYHYLPQEEI